jgi:hypothetical protein
LDPICLDPSTESPASAAASTSSIGSSGEENSPPIINSAESGGDLVDLLNKISYDSEDESSSDLLLQNIGAIDAIDFNFTDNSDSAASEDDFTDLYDGVSYASEGEWSSCLPLQDEDPTIIDFKLNNNTNPITRKVHPYPDVCTNNVRFTHHQICAVIENTSGAESEDFDSTGNPFVNPVDLIRGTRRQTAPEAGDNASGAEGMRADPVQVRISMAVWDKVKKAMSGEVPMAEDATQQELMAYQYLLHHQKHELVKIQ